MWLGGGVNGCFGLCWGFVWENGKLRELIGWKRDVEGGGEYRKKIVEIGEGGGWDEGDVGKGRWEDRRGEDGWGEVGKGDGGVGKGNEGRSGMGGGMCG